MMCAYDSLASEKVSCDELLMPYQNIIVFQINEYDARW